MPKVPLKLHLAVLATRWQKQPCELVIVSMQRTGCKLLPVAAGKLTEPDRKRVEPKPEASKRLKSSVRAVAEL